MNTRKIPRWVRFSIFSGIVIFLAGATLFGYRYYSRPVTLAVAVGSVDDEAPKVISAIASRLASKGAPVRLKIIDTITAFDAGKNFSAGDSDLAVVRSDYEDLSGAQAVVVLARLPILIIVPPGSPIDSAEKLRGQTVGVISGRSNSKVIAALTKEYDLDGTRFKDVFLADARHAIQDKKVAALLIAMPLTEKYLSLVRGIFQQGPKALPTLIPVESAAAISEINRAYESFDIPKGTLRGAPANPAEDTTTFRTTLYLVANKKLSSELVSSLTQSIMDARRDLLNEDPILAHITSPSTDPDSFLEVHPGAAAFFNGTRQSFLDRYGNAIFLGPMVIGAVLSVLAAASKFLSAGNPGPEQGPLDLLYALARRIRKVDAENHLSEIEDEIEEILKTQHVLVASGDENAVDASTLNVAAHRLASLIHDRRGALRQGSTVFHEQSKNF